MDDDPVLLGLADKLLEIFFEVFDHLRADGVGLLPARLWIRQSRERAETCLCTAFGIVVERLLFRRFYKADPSRTGAI